MPEFQVPPEGATFRIIGNVSGRALYSRLTGDPVFGAVLASAGANKDQYWSLVKGMGSKEGLFLFKNSVSGNVLYSRATTPPYVWHVGGGGRYFDNWFKFLPGTGEHAGMVRLVAPSTDTVLVSRANTTEIANHPYAGYVVYDDQWFKFEYEKVEQVEMTPPHLITSTSQHNISYPYTITVHVFQSKPDSGVFFRVVEQMTRYANTNEWNVVPGGLAFKSEYSGTSGSLRFADKGGEQFVVSVGVHNCKRWCDIVTDLSTAQTAATVNAEYNTNASHISQREKQLPHCTVSSNKGRTIQVNYSVAEGNNLVANVIIG